ncbi:winged helix-turn-helix transcriptional regulator [Streptomyces marincola]|uniref:HTH hxlR-type domain-containing protein n=1 Tax=Streptomyces marincola TaxID=2878388 RepID=A0A1W7CZE4_9ACTN|nr:helix-turn-helix domain-containing protein [Streptomyces marincola]ARQ70211.1 hypothetical protein CAG99_16390 [Streptomyces marincola]
MTGRSPKPLAPAVLTGLASRWALLIVDALAEETLRYTRLHGRVDGISHQMLARTLRALERDGIVVRTAHATVPPRVEYALTPAGRDLRTRVAGMCAWSRAHLPEIEAARERFAAEAEHTRLRRAGLAAVPGGPPAAPLTATDALAGPARRPGDGGREIGIDRADPFLVPRANAAWARLALRYRLYGPAGEFLLATAVDDGPPRWRAVRVLPGADLMGAGAAAFLGTAAGRPEFAALSPDGRVALRATTGAARVRVIAVPTDRPGRDAASC